MGSIKINYLFLLCILVIGQVNADTNKRTENNGNLILQNIPVIPDNIKNDLTQYQNVRSAPFRGFNQEGTQIYITTRFGNVSQLHKVKYFYLLNYSCLIHIINPSRIGAKKLYTLSSL